MAADRTRRLMASALARVPGTYLTVTQAGVAPEQDQVDVEGRTKRDFVNESGVGYQQCGGGRRVLRKRIGGN